MPRWRRPNDLFGADSLCARMFRQCASWGGLDKARIEEILKLHWKIEELQDVNELTTLLRN